MSENQPNIELFAAEKRTDGTGGNGGGKRLDEIKTRLTKLEVHHEYLATKADLSELESRISKSIESQTRWIVGFLLGGLALAVATFRLFPIG